MNRKVNTYVAVVILGALSVLVFKSPRIALHDLPELLILAGCAALFESYPITLPNRWQFSPASVFAFLAYARMGWSVALLVELASAAAHLRKRNRPVQKLFNTGQLVLSIYAFDVAVRLVGGRTAPLTLWGAVTILAGAGAFYLTNAVLVIGVIRFASGRPVLLMLPDMLPDLGAGVLSASALTLPVLYSFERSDWVSFASFVVALLAFRHTVNLYLRQKRIHLDAISHLTAVIERRSGGAERHAARVAALAKTCAEALKLAPEQVDLIYTAALLHDIGEVEVDARTVDKLHRRIILTRTEQEAYGQHAALGAALVERMEGMAPIAGFIRHHHEHWDGSGYPNGLAGEAIPLGARILAAAEALEAEGGDLDARLTALTHLAGRVIDPSLLRPLSAALRKCERSTARAEALAGGTPAADLPGDLIQSAQGSKLLESLGIGMIIVYREGRFTNFHGRVVQPPAAETLGALAVRSQQSLAPVREHVLDQGRVFDVYCIPNHMDSVTVLVFDITGALAAEREQFRRVLRAYRDVMLAATHGRLRLLEPEEAERECAAGESLAAMDLLHVSDGEAARTLAHAAALTCGLSARAAFHLKLCTAEAAANVFKHAGTGSIEVRRLGDSLRVIVRDKGAGIPLEILPQAILVEGYSTQVSLGKGFTVMLRLVHRLMVHTAAEGTILILEMELAEAPEPERPMPANTERREEDRVATGNGRRA